MHFKKSLISVLSFSTFFIPFCSHADFTFPRTVNLLVVNGNKVSEPDSIILPKGDNQLVIRYEQELKKGSGTKKLVTKPLVIVVEVGDSSDEMAITHKRFREYHAANAAFANNKADWSLIINGEKQAISPVILPGNPGMLPYRDIEKAVANFNLDHGIKLTSVESLQEPIDEEVAAQVQSETEMVIVEQPVELKVEDTFVTDIKKWYLKASGEERKSLLKWMIDNQ
ncbi:DUF2057 domain-containing protein [Vibrio sp. JC009]|uniref:DUF2057 family protein n=1 Tax=Vibrio sp. JC009 TaxID=2912314 RepID=UPI0023AF0B0E|nr:DUF2057 family protein [Vibrio sp. JC009]WED20606.1 DUF2057 domain-containing protein [Vibrio sp. JC009]